MQPQNVLYNVFGVASTEVQSRCRPALGWSKGLADPNTPLHEAGIGQEMGFRDGRDVGLGRRQ